MNAWSQVHYAPDKIPSQLAQAQESPLPDSLKTYWDWFIRLSNHRQSGMGINSISYLEMKAFFDLHGIYPEPYEVEVIEMFDRIAVKYFSEQQEKETARAKAKK